jgi:hypothetical protein
LREQKELLNQQLSEENSQLEAQLKGTLQICRLRVENPVHEQGKRGAQSADPGLRLTPERILGVTGGANTQNAGSYRQRRVIVRSHGVSVQPVLAEERKLAYYCD